MSKECNKNLNDLKEHLIKSISLINGELGKVHKSITDYGHFGIVPTREVLVRFKDIYHLNSLTRNVMSGRYRDIGFEPTLEDSISAFCGRLKLDLFDNRNLPNELIQLMGNKDINFLHEKNNLQVKELSQLSQKHITTIRNEYLMSKKYKSHINKIDGLTLIPIEIAKEICLNIKSFIPSPSIQGPDQIYVPVSKDGSVFSEHNKSANGFRIGPKGDEYSVDSYDKALGDLLSMEPRAYWRRKNAKGHWGVVSAFRWEYKNKAEIYINN